jgi:hypothetical protein
VTAIEEERRDEERRLAHTLDYEPAAALDQETTA